MGISNSISRLAEYYRRHGIVSTIRRAVLGTRRALFSNRMVVFYCDLGAQPAAPLNPPELFRVERVTSCALVGKKDLRDITDFWNPKLALRNIGQRFEMGASLWLIRSGENLAGYGWTLQGRTVEPYYFPLAPDDVHLFDFHVFPRYRGQGLNSILVTFILNSCANAGRGRAFIEAAEWNESQLASLRKTPFRLLGLANFFRIFGRTYGTWTRGDAVRLSQEQVEPKNFGPTVRRPHVH